MTSQVALGNDGSPTEDPVGRTGGSRRRRRVLTGAVVGAVLLGAGGAALAGSAAPESGASALVQSYPDPATVENPTTGTIGGDEAARNATYVETELVSLNGTDLATQVAAATGTPAAAVQLEAVRVGDSNVITITSTSTDEQDAVAQAQSAAELYVTGRQQRLTTRITALLGTVESQIAANQAAIDAVPEPPDDGVDVNEQQRAALSQQNVDLLNARDTLQRAAADVGQIAGIIQQANALPTGAVSSTVLTVAAGILIGALLGAVLAPVVSALRGRVRDGQDVTGLGVPVLTPDLPVARGGRRSSQLSRAVQLQGLQLPEGPLYGGSVAVVAAGPGVGTTFTAVAHARHSASRRRTLLVCYDEDAVAALVGGLHEHSVLTLGSGTGAAGHSAPIVAATQLACRQVVDVPELWIVTVGQQAAHGRGGLDDVVPDGLVARAVEAGWAVVVDAPPLDRSAEGARAARHCSETLVVAAAGLSRISDVDRAVQILHGAGATPSGIVVNRLPRRGSGRSARPGPAARSRPGGPAHRPASPAGPDEVPTEGPDRFDDQVLDDAPDAATEAPAGRG